MAVSRVSFSLRTLVALLLFCCAVSQDSPSLDKEQFRGALVETACDVRNNPEDYANATEAFYQRVREKHGVYNITKSDERSAGAQHRNSKSIECFNKCPNATANDVIWCVNVFSQRWNVEVCLNHTWRNASLEADIAGISEHFSVERSCRYEGEDCLHVTDARIYLNNAYLTCTSQTNSCLRKTFIHFTVDTQTFATDPPQVDVKSSQGLVLGQTNILECTGYFHSLFGFLGWQRIDMDDIYPPISQDPYCDSTVEDCRVDSVGIRFINDRVRVYTYNIATYQACTYTEEVKRSLLFINDTTEADVTSYICLASVWSLLSPAVPVIVPKTITTFAGITGPPVSITAFLDSNATFYCTAFRSGVFWLVNDTRATDISLLQRGIRFFITSRIGEDTVARLTIPASASHNNTRAQCGVYTDQGVMLLSDEVQLKVQGLLAAPQNLQIKALSENENTMVLSWSPPFTLDVSNTDPNIAGYRVYAITANTGYQEMYPISANVTEYQFMINKQLQCYLHVFRVSANNEVGEGDMTDPVSVSVCPGDKNDIIKISLPDTEVSTIMWDLTNKFRSHKS